MSNETNVEFFTPGALDERRATPGSQTGVYLDDLQRVKAEVHRAKAEGREPDLDNAPAVVGTPLKRAPEIVSADHHNYVPPHIKASETLPVTHVAAKDRVAPAVEDVTDEDDSE